MQLGLDLPLRDLYTARQAGEAAAQACADKADGQQPGFSARARAFVIDYLATHGDTPGEDIVQAGIDAGIQAHDARAWGNVFRVLSGKRIRCLRADLPRRLGHGTTGGKLWGLM